ncbi:MAG: Jag N-terminal domain-containing protein [Streptococcaceae bacterium]|nr:Jag N-terminal domain-containing protein [Streptococcaceae bacterium]MCL2858171.1 Jag N-terminal domain-containing protein [Streptococcaceae bacterium]
MAIFTGETVEIAIERGLKRLKAKRENVHIRVEQRDKKGFLGIGKKRARVNIEEIEDVTVRKADFLAERGVDTEENDLGVPKAQSAMEATLELSQVVKAVRAAEKEHDGEFTAEEREALIEEAKVSISQDTAAHRNPLVSEDIIATTQQSLSEEESKITNKISVYLTQITQEMGIATTISTEKKDNLIIFQLNSEHDALLIGKHGKILQSMQVLAKTYANSLSENRVKIAVNVGDYYEKRKAYIISLAHHAAERARAGEPVYINDLQANERKTVHKIIAEESGVVSYSEGPEFKRSVAVNKEV